MGSLVCTEQRQLLLPLWRQRVLSRDDSTGAQGYKRVVRLFRGETNQVVHVRIAKAASVQRGRSQRHRVGQGKGGSSSDGEEGSEPARPGADDEQTLRCTTEHPFWVVGRGWVPAGELRVGDELSGSQGERLVVSGHEVREEHAKHYNFEVEDWHTYFVSETEADPAVWSHNICGDDEIALGFNQLLRKSGRWFHEPFKRGYAGARQARGAINALEEFAEKTGSLPYQKWGRHNVDLVGFQGFKDAADTARHIHFNLDGFSRRSSSSGIGTALRRVAGGGPTKGLTERELFHVLSNSGLRDKTTFYRNGKAVADPMKFFSEYLRGTGIRWN